MQDHPVLTIPNHHPTKMDVLPTNFVQNILAAKWLVRNSSTSPKQQWQPLPSLLSLSVFHACKHPFISNTHHKHTSQWTNVISFRINIKSQRDPEFTYHLMEQGCTLYSVHRLRLKFSFSMTRVQIISPYFQSIEVIPVDNSFSCWIPR